MCAIFGIINAYPERELHESLEHRGPDSTGMTSIDQYVTMGHSLLSIIGKQQQPIEGDRYAISYNGEAYNYDRSCASDSLWVLSLIEKYGVPGFISHITGMFSIAVYDMVDLKLHLIVDRMSEKPCYWYADENTFAFASSPNALLHLKPKWRINSHALQSYWKLGAVMEGSIWEGIHKVPAACYITYDINAPITHAGKLTLTNYWQPQYQPNTSGIEDLVRQSIDNVKVADVPVYIFLSGGIDSTLVASRFKGGHAIHLDGPERSWAEMVTKKYDMTLHVVSPRKCDPVAALSDYVRKCGEPTMAGLIPYITAQEAATLCRVAVTANGADELFFGYDRTTQDVTVQQTRHIFRSLPGVINVPEIDERLSRGRWLELMTYVQHDLNRTLDFASMAHSVEVRSPYLNHELVEMALSMTPEQIGRKGTLKEMLRKEGFNDAFLNRRKMGFSLYEEPKGLGQLMHDAYMWCTENGYLERRVDYSARDAQYLRSAALGFKVWWENYKNKIE